MKIIKKALLGLVTALCPVVIAACYGPPTERFEVPIIEPPESAKACTVVDNETKTGIAGIQALCRRDIYHMWATFADENGVFRIIYDEQCDYLVLMDRDGRYNGGLYGKKKVPFPAEDEECAYELDGITQDIHDVN